MTGTSSIAPAVRCTKALLEIIVLTPTAGQHGPSGGGIMIVRHSQVKTMRRAYNLAMPPARCPQCAFESPAGMRFCGRCGAALEPRCPHCGVEAPPGFRFCGQCGKSLQEAPSPGPAAPPAEVAPAPERPAAYTPKHLADKILKSRSALEGERRQVTVLFADMAGFTSLAEKLDPEEVHRIVNACFERITAEVHRFEGTINQYTGDGVMALFGAPIAHEDSARRAVHAALGIQRAIADYAATLRAERGLSVAMRIGLNTGAVVVGAIGDDLRMDYTAVGDTTNLAARLQQAARPGTVLVSDSTHRAIEGFFETLDLGRLQVKGHEPVRAWQVVRTRGARSRIAVGHERGLTPYVGRDRELQTLLARFADVEAGRGQVVFIVGDAGIGKSRLLYEFRRRLAEDGRAVSWVEGQCVSFGQSIPFLPLVDLLRKNFGIEEFDGEPEIIAKVEAATRRMGGLDEHVPFIRYLLSVDPGDAAVATMDAPGRRRLAFAALRALALRGAELRPVVLVVEDLHWMDPGSEEFLGSLMESIAGVAVMLVLTYRVGYAPAFGSRSYYSTISLTTLGEQDALAVARGVLGVSELPRELLAALMQKAEGVPLFIEEVAKTLLDLGVLRREGERLVFVGGPEAIDVPETINDIIMARLDRLGDAGKRTVQLASVIGRQFLVRLLGRVSGMSQQLDGLLSELQALEIIYQQGLLPEPAYVFKHAVIQDVAYKSLLRERRRELHRRVAFALEELYPDRLAEHYEELAHHFSEGEEWSKAFEYLERSGDRAREAYANATALDWYARALEAAGRVTPPVSRVRLARVHQRRAQILTAVARMEEARGECRQMLEYARAEGDRRLEAEAHADLAYCYYMTLSWDHVVDVESHSRQAYDIARDIDDERLIGRTLYLMASIDQMQARLSEAESKYAESLALARTGNYRDIVVQSQTMLSLQRNWQGRFDDAITMSVATEAECREIHDGFTEVLATSTRCFALIGRGDYRGAWDTLAAGRALARDRQNHFMFARMGNTLGWLHQEYGQFAGAVELNSESRDIGHRIKNANVEISALIDLGFSDLALKGPRPAVDLFAQTLERARKAFGAHRWRWSIHLAFGLTTALMALGRDGEALAEVERGLAEAEQTESLKYVGWFHARRGELALRAGDAAAAASDLDRAVAIARRIGYPTLAWQAADLLARARLRLGHGEQAGAAARLAEDTLAAIAAAAPDAALADSLRRWPRVQEMQETVERVRRM
jgi:class 3 adenylate cyclase/tetratricopeptide (TPR) repeat protein